MFFWGTANPTGENSSYDGTYLRRDEINDMVLDRELIDLPVKIEHTKGTVGRVVSAWQHDGRLDLLVKLGGESKEGTGDSIETSIAKSFVNNKICKELSLGYTVEMQHSEGGIKTGKKIISEVSIVKAGARERCLIYDLMGS